MKKRRITGGAIVVTTALALALIFQPSSRSALAASNELLTYNGGGQGVSGACGASNYETCPHPFCMCLSSTGLASGALIGSGFATLDMIVSDKVAGECQPFNASMFIIAPKDLEELDFSGTSCDNLRTFSGNYVIAVSQAGNSGLGTVSGTISKKLKYALTFR